MSRMSFRRSVAAVGVLALAPLAGALPAAAQTADPDPERISFYNITDFHGRVVGVGEKFSCILNSDPDAYFISAGDNIGATTFVSAVADDYPTIDLLSLLDLKVSSIGNHELDKGWDDFRTKDAAGTYDHVAANVLDANTLEPVWETHVIHEIDGYQVAFVGALPLSLPSKISPAILEGMTVTDPADAMNAVAAELNANEDIDLVIGLMHDDAATFGTQLEGFDVAFGGDSHVPYTGETADGAPLLQAGQYGERIANVVFEVSENGGLTITESVVTDIREYSVPDGCADPAVTQLIAEAEDKATELGSVAVAEITADFNRGQLSSGSENRGTESTIGNLVADAHLWAAREAGNDADFAFMNPGGLRTDLGYDAVEDRLGDDDGVVTYEEAANVQPFGNTLMTLTLTGESIFSILNEQWQPEGAPRPFLALGVAGLTFEYDPAAELVTQVYLEDGTAIDPAAEYLVVTNSFLAVGGDNFTSFTDGTNLSDTGQIDLTATVSYLQQYDGVLTPDYVQRSIGVTEKGVAASGVLNPGVSVEVDVSSLAFTTNEPKPEHVVAVFDGEDAGTFEIDNSITDLFNDTGRASVTFQAPQFTIDQLGETKVLEIYLESTDGRLLASLEYEVGGPFADVPSDHVFFDEITWAAESGISTGWQHEDGTATFQPYSTTNRDMMAAFLFRLAALQDETVNDYEAPAVSPFVDVPTNRVFYREIAWLAENDVSTGWILPNGDAQFRPLEPVLRDQMATFLHRVAALYDEDVADFTAPARSPFLDVPTSHVFYDEIAWAQSAGISTGWIGDDGTAVFRPYSETLRDVMATFLMRTDALLNAAV